MGIDIQFKPLQQNHFDLLEKWLNTPHVHEWWGEGEIWTPKNIETKYTHYLKNYKLFQGVPKPIYGYIIVLDNIPIGYIQYYNAYDFPRDSGDALENLPESLASFDFYIGEIDYIGKKLAVPILTTFIEKHIYPHFMSIIVEVEIKNIVAYKVYEKAGFKQIKLTQNKNNYWMMLEKEGK